MKRDKKVLSIQEACDAMDNRMVSFKRMIHAFTDFEVGLFAGLIMKEMDRRNKINEKMKEEASVESENVSKIEIGENDTFAINK